MATGASLVQDEYATGKDGPRWFQVIKTPVNDEQGNPSGLICSVRDITERKRAEEALQTQTRVLESMAEGVTVTERRRQNHLFQPGLRHHVRVSTGGIDRAIRLQAQ